MLSVFYGKASLSHFALSGNAAFQAFCPRVRATEFSQLRPFDRGLVSIARLPSGILNQGS